jgi:hypothetical protein
MRHKGVQPLYTRFDQCLRAFLIRPPPDVLVSHERKAQLGGLGA